jgi:hypothetical protein
LAQAKRGVNADDRISPAYNTCVIASEAKQSSFLERRWKKESWIASSLRSSQ